MTENEKNCYVYQHVRLDKNEIFYIGIGKTKNYKRAYSKSGRNSYWYNVVNKTDYKVEIIVDNLSWEEASTKEIELITLHGRKDLGIGTLVNLTDGGQGATNVKVSEETKLKLSEAKKGKKYSDSHRLAMSKSKKGVKLSEEHKANLFNPQHRKNLSEAAKGKSNMTGKKHKEGFFEKKCLKIIDCVTLEIFRGCKEAAKAYNMPYNTLYNWLNNDKLNKTNLKYYDS